MVNEGCVGGGGEREREVIVVVVVVVECHVQSLCIEGEVCLVAERHVGPENELIFVKVPKQFLEAKVCHVGPENELIFVKVSKQFLEAKVCHAGPENELFFFC